MASTKVDNRGSFGSKRSRNDESRSDGDWTCPKCGNVNFGFRIVCNRGKCGAPRPSVTPPAPITSLITTLLPFILEALGLLLCHMECLAGMDPQCCILDCIMTMVPLRVLMTYGPLATFPPASYGGMGYGSGPAVSGYGFGFQGSPWAGDVMPDNPASRKRRGGPDGLHEGDWVCPKCDNVNFAFRTTCNIKKCGAPRPSHGPKQSNTGAPEGSWTCDKCGNLNYPFRSVCNRKDCGNEKPASGK